MLITGFFAQPERTEILRQKQEEHFQPHLAADRALQVTIAQLEAPVQHRANAILTLLPHWPTIVPQALLLVFYAKPDIMALFPPDRRYKPLLAAVRARQDTFARLEVPVQHRTRVAVLTSSVLQEALQPQP